MKTILNSRHLLNNIRNGEHFEFHASVIKLMTDKMVLLPGLTRLWNVYRPLFEREDLIFKQHRKAAETEQIQAADKKRDDTFMMFKRTVDFSLHSADPVTKTAAKKLKYVLDNFKGVNTKAYVENTALLSNMIQELEKPENASAVTQLALTATVVQLKTENLAFSDIYSERATSQYSKKELGTMETIRPKTDNAYVELADGINTLYKSNEMLAQDEEMRELLGSIIDTINSYILQWESSYIRRSPNKKPDNKPDDNNPVQPDIPNDPDEPQNPDDPSDPDDPGTYE
ncbi:hypothetical protein M2101_000317 [Parabacteroides sp. PM5-20]|uniref:DUF6261 family protein n=1 Tax=unclassified Parabacteroides TaxID=2649774 RepID=UPI0013D34DD5|nr:MULTISPECIES: DUF6261 family protein [unclassified Parabacteroides]MDH6533676.1 hypothetical protein [Parabacteroides sp. PM5-20]